MPIVVPPTANLLDPRSPADRELAQRYGITVPRSRSGAIPRALDTVAHGPRAETARIDTSYDGAPSGDAALTGEALRSALCHFVHTALTDARTAAQEPQTRMQQCLRQRNGEYAADEKALHGAVDIFLNITGTKCQAAQDWLSEIYVSIKDSPFTCDPTPEPEISSSVREMAIERAYRELAAQPGIVSRDEMLRVVEGYKQLARSAALKVAKQAAERMTSVIKDQLVQGDWATSFAAFLYDLTTYPVAILKGPIVTLQQRLKWRGNKLDVVIDKHLTVRRVSPFDFFPSRDSTTPHDGQYVIEIERYLPHQLAELRELDGFDAAAIDMAGADHAEAGLAAAEALALSGEKAQDGAGQGTTQALNSQTTHYGLMDVVKYYGRVPVSVLMESHASLVRGRYRPDQWVEAEVWVLGEHVLYATLNPDALGRRPFHAASWRKRAGAFYGQALPEILRDCQRIANSSARALVRNMAFASGPMAEIDTTRLANGEVPSELTPWKLWLVKSDPFGGGHKALSFYDVPSNASELLSVFERFVRYAEEISGIPAYVQGLGGAGFMRTLGSYALALKNASKGVQAVVGMVDADVLVPLVTRYYDYNMLYHPDAGIKADARVLARGAEGLLAKDAARAKALELLQIVIPYVQGGLIPPEGVLVLLREVLMGQGLPVDSIVPDPEIQRELGRLGANVANMRGTPGVAASQPNGGLNISLPTGAVPNLPPTPTLDGRSLPA